MNKKEIADTLRVEVDAMEDLIKKLKARSDRLKRMLSELDAEAAGSPPPSRELKVLGPDSKFRKVIDRVFGEPPRKKR